MEGGTARWMHAAGAGLALFASVAAFTACGGAPLSAPTKVSARQFVANATGLIDQLRADLVISGSEGQSLALARRALRDSSDQFAMLVVYDDFGSCSQMVRDVGATNGRFGRVKASLGSACSYLQRAASLFTAAETRSDPRTLRAASRTSQRASPLLFRATAELGLASTSSG